MVQRICETKDHTNNWSAPGVPTLMEQVAQGQTLISYQLETWIKHLSKKQAPTPLKDAFMSFMEMRLPRFLSATKTMEVDDWLQIVSKNLETIACTYSEKVRFATLLLEGPTREWWDRDKTSHSIWEMT